jgi:hypothetical protein
MGRIVKKMKEWIISIHLWKTITLKKEVSLNTLTNHFIQCRWGEVSISHLFLEKLKDLKVESMIVAMLRILDSTILKEISKKNRSRGSSFRSNGAQWYDGEDTKDSLKGNLYF